MITIPDYRDASTLTDDEIVAMMKIIYPSIGAESKGAAKVIDIDRSKPKSGIIGITVESTWYDCETDDPYRDTNYFELLNTGYLLSYDLAIPNPSSVNKYLLSLGCCSLLKDNPYLS